MLDRAHRIGNCYDVDGVEKQGIIVRFTTFRHRTQLYYKRKEIKAQHGISIRLDLTKDNLTTLKDANEFVKSREDVSYAYADVNCRLKVKLTGGREFFFNDIDDLKCKLL